MKNMLIAWELGGNLGHYGNITTLAKYFNNYNFNIILALKDLANINLFDIPKNIKVIQAPICKLKKFNFPEIYTYSEILYSNGYHCPVSLSNLVEQWVDIIKQFKIDIILNDYAPTSVLAGKIKNIPTVSINSGFFIPPITNEVIVFKDWVKIDKQQYMANEFHVLDSINYLFKDKRIKFKLVTEAVRADLNFISSYPELDHYKNNRTSLEKNDFVGGLRNCELGEKYDWPNLPGKKILAYLNVKTINLKNIILELIKINLPVILYIKNLSDEYKILLKNTNILLTDSLINLNFAFKDCDLFICNGGVNSTTSSLENGTPVLLIPTTAEQFIFSRNIAELKLGTLITSKNITSFNSILNEVLINDIYSKNAIIFKNKYNYCFNDNYTLNKIRDKISDLICF